MSLLRFFSLSVILTLFNAYAVDVYVKVPSGEVKRYETKSSINSETLIWDPTQYGDRPELKDGETFVIVTVEVAAGKSIGKYDFNLNGAQCIAMATTRTNFNPGNWEYIYGKNLPDGTQVQLLYISKKQKIYLLQYRYDLVSEVYPPEMTSVQLSEDKALIKTAAGAVDKPAINEVAEKPKKDEPEPAKEEVKKEEPKKEEPKAVEKPKKAAPAIDDTFGEF